MLNFEKIPLEEESPDLSDDEIQGAIETLGADSFISALEEFVRPIGRPNLSAALKSELRRRNGNLYCRARILLAGEPDKVVLFKVNWLKR